MSTNQSNSKKSPNSTKKGGIWLIIGAFTSAILATSCCLPALVFLLFGSSFAALSVFEPLTKYRWVLSAISFLFFVLFVYFKFIKKCSSCEITKKSKLKSAVMLFIAFLVFVFILFYPEILGWVYA
ncbi:MAG: aryl sulfotransferase [Campylobacteraceae bacterium]|nr:aryl sulfotransferase [Campylobacteraceae bacterium]